MKTAAPSCRIGQLLVHVLLFFNASEHNASGKRSGNHIGIFLAVSEVKSIAIVRTKEYILSSFREAMVVLHICQGLATQAAGIDEHTGVGEYLV
jgi:hypothetical protein